MAQREASDEWLMGQVALGRESALEQLMKRYHRVLLSFIHHQTDLEAEDLYQETWIRVVRNAEKYDMNRKFSTWLFKIAANLCRDAHRRRRARIETVALEAAARAHTPERDEAATELQAGINKLPEQDRELLALRYYQGFKETEVAEILDLPLGTVKSRTHQAVKRLKTMMEREQRKLERES